jgi:hypothetical protein
MTASPFTRAFLLMFSGPIIWAGHFLSVYVLAALACARSFAHIEWFGVAVPQWGIGLITAMAIAAILLVQRRRGEPVTPFVGWTTSTLGWLSALAIVWAAVPAYLVPACG